VPELNYKALTFMLSVINTVAIVATIIYAHLMNKQKVNADAIEQTNENHTALNVRVIKVEKAIEHMPSHEDIAKLNRRVGEVAQEVTKLQGTTAQMNNSVQLIHNHLLNKK
jgi:hypothetical protein